MKQLILVEGLPGTGKTTTAKRISVHFALNGINAITLFEGDSEIPCDFYVIAGVPTGEFDAFCAVHPESEDISAGEFLRTASYVYLRLDKCSDVVADAFRKWDMGDDMNRQVSVEQYIPCALERIDHWVASNRHNENTVIIDSGFLQNPINELLFREASDARITSFIHSIAEKLRPLNPVCLYLKRESAASAIAFAKEAKGPDWAAGVDAMLREGACPNFFERRFELELCLLPSIPHAVCSVIGSDWADVDRKIQQLF